MRGGNPSYYTLMLHPQLPHCSQSRLFEYISTGVPMDDIHMPSVASSRYTNGVATPSKPKTLTELTADKDRIESELSALGSVLDSVCSSSSRQSAWLMLGSIAWRQHEHNSHNF